MPENDGVDIDRHGVAGERLLGVEPGGLDALVDHRSDGIDDRNDKEQPRPFHARQLAEAQDHEAFPVVGHLEREQREDGENGKAKPGQLHVRGKQQRADDGENDGEQ